LFCEFSPNSIGADEVILWCPLLKISEKDSASILLSFFCPGPSVDESYPLGIKLSEWLKPPFLASIPLPTRSLVQPLGLPLHPAKTAGGMINTCPPLWSLWAKLVSIPYRPWGSGPDHNRILLHTFLTRFLQSMFVITENAAQVKVWLFPLFRLALQSHPSFLHCNLVLKLYLLEEFLCKVPTLSSSVAIYFSMS